MAKKKKMPRVATIANSIQDKITKVKVKLSAFRRGNKVFKEIIVLDSKGHVLISMDSFRNTIEEITKEVEEYFGEVWEPNFDPMKSKRDLVIEKFERIKLKKVFDFGYMLKSETEIRFYHLLFNKVEVGILNRKTGEYEEVHCFYDSISDWTNK